MRILHTMGSICSNQNRNDLKPPADLSELLQQAEKVKLTHSLAAADCGLFQSGSPSLTTPSWLSEFQKFCSDLDTRTKLTWRSPLLDFVMEARTINKLSKEISNEKEKEETLTNLVLQLEERHFTEGGLAVSDSQLRERLVTDLETFRGQVKGARGVRRALEGGGGSVSLASLASTLQEVYLDPSVWDRLDKLYLQFLHKNPTLPTLAVLLSIL